MILNSRMHLRQLKTLSQFAAFMIKIDQDQDQDQHENEDEDQNFG